MTVAPRLFSFYAAAIGFGLAIDAQDPDAPVESTGAEAQQRMRRLLERANTAARAQGKSAADVDSAAFALTAWFDEVAGRRRDWADAIAPLQLLWFNSTNAATEFFHHLSALQSDQGELRELYWYLLAIGFQGQYYFEGQNGAGELAKLRALHAAQLPQPLLELQLPRPRLCAQPYTVPRAPAAAPQRDRRAWRWPLLVALLLILVPVGAWMAQQLAPPAAQARTLAMQANEQLQRHACAVLNAEQAADGVLRVNGFVPSAGTLAQVRQEIGALAGATPTELSLQLRPWPYCEVVDILQAHQLRNARSRQPMALEAPSAHDGVLREGQSVVLQLRTPEREGVVWVDYYTADGAVLHLRAQGQRRVPFSAGQTVRLGEDLPSSWLVSPPFGTVLITAVALPASGVPASTEPPPYELASDYLLRLRETLAAVSPDARPVADLLFLQTGER
ncbi:DotU family type IV/VI secretion system protein [Xenophilus arseniciresistens]|uniref:DotU family type IV/VI secretion system protein n=1 Tax=Xenophilus arseniciresistens TaxID=1283306 RepID=A0AAE3NBT3_9BURK|nr:DotU family type IV/VI secretion system protein [Xenophilus arseniciresistens]MDA7418786.1 DotU family type IV/VI secretion system protein [Xenophilus arseniciresistens]